MGGGEMSSEDTYSVKAILYVFYLRAQPVIGARCEI